MKPTEKELKNWAISQIKTKYPDDIALLIGVEGHSLESDCHGLCFDYFIPATEKGAELATTFILDGVGHDLYPRSWGRINNMAMFEDHFTNGLADGIILYSRSEEDTMIFDSYRKKLFANLKDNHFMFKKALEQLDEAMDIYRSMMFEDKLHLVRLGAGNVAYMLSLSVAFINNTYFKNKLDLPIEELKLMNKIPTNFISYYEDIVNASTIDSLRQLSHDMIGTTRNFLNKHKPTYTHNLTPKEIDYQYLTSWYEEMSLTLRRIYIHCDENNSHRVFGDALSLQTEYNIIQEEFNLEPQDALSLFDANNLEAFKVNTLNIEKYIVEVIKSNNVKINSYKSLDEFLKKYNL